jgi:hypothetical protein
MGTDDASSADMRRVFTHPDADPLALDDETVERLLAGELPPAEAPPGYAGVAELLAATAAPPTPEELAGRAAALAQLRVVTRTPPVTRAWRAGRRARRRRAGLAVVVVVGALTAGSAAAATGNLPGPVADAARSILTTVAGGGAEPAPPTTPGRQSDPAARAPAPGGASTAQGSGPADADSPGPVGTGTAAGPAKEGLCRAFMAGQGDDRGKKLDAAAFQALAEAAGGADRIPAYCQGIEPGPDPPKKPRQSAPPDDQEQGPVPGGPPTDTGGGAQGQGTPPDSTGSSSR